MLCEKRVCYNRAGDKMKSDFIVIFDLDGTLLNTDLLIRKSFEHVFHKYKPDYILNDEEHLSFLGPTLMNSFERYFPNTMIDELVACYREYNLSHHNDFVTIYPTVKTTLEKLKSMNYPMAVVTTKKKDVANLGLSLFGIAEYFDMIIGLEDVKNVKPHPEGILKVLKEMHCYQGVMIGDNITDLMAGKNAGIYTIGVNWTPKGTQEMEALKPDCMIDQMEEVIDFVKGVN